MDNYEYRLIINHTGWFAEFESDVNKAIKEGWRPLGGISVTRVDDVSFPDGLTTLPQFYLVQAMTREVAHERE